jgi:hypothetical protein
MNKPCRARLHMLALFLPLTAALYIDAEALSPKGADQVINTGCHGVGLRRSRNVPRWLAVLFTAGLATAEAQSAKSRRWPGVTP